MMVCVYGSHLQVVSHSYISIGWFVKRVGGQLADRQTDRQTNGRTDTHVTASFSRTAWVKVKPFWVVMKQEMLGWQWHQLDYMQIIYTSF